MLLTVLLLIGQVDFEPERRFGVAVGVQDFVCADLDGQNGPDIIAAVLSDESVVVLRNRGVIDGIWRGFTPPQRAAAQVQPHAVDTCDVDGDGDLDVITGTGDGIARWLNDGDGNLTQEEFFPGGTTRNRTPIRVFCALSGSLNVVRFDREVMIVFHHRPDGTFAPAPAVRDIGGSDAQLCDIDGNGTVDVVQKVSGDAFTVSLSTHQGSLAPAILYGDTVRLPSNSVACGDLDGDGALDVLTGRLTLFRGRLDGTLVPSGPIVEGLLQTAVIQLAIVDIDSDGDGDVITTTSSGLEVFTNDGVGGFDFPSTSNLSALSILRTCDIDLDGDIDVIVGNNTQISVLLNTARHPELILGDVDGDGDVDLADYLVLEACLTDPGREPFFAECHTFDFDADNDVDLSDLIAFQAAFTGAR